MVGLLVLLQLDPGQHLAETLVLYDGGVADALQRTMIERTEERFGFKPEPLAAAKADVP
jgi:hypothetical protein